MVKCSFCSNETAVGRGIRIFKRDGSSNFFCSKKCERNFDLNRKPSKLKWTNKSK